MSWNFCGFSGTQEVILTSLNTGTVYPQKCAKKRWRMNVRKTKYHRNKTFHDVFMQIQYLEQKLYTCSMT